MRLCQAHVRNSKLVDWNYRLLVWHGRHTVTFMHIMLCEKGQWYIGNGKTVESLYLHSWIIFFSIFLKDCGEWERKADGHWRWMNLLQIPALPSLSMERCSRKKCFTWPNRLMTWEKNRTGRSKQLSNERSKAICTVQVSHFFRILMSTCWNTSLGFDWRIRKGWGRVWERVFWKSAVIEINRLEMNFYVQDQICDKA